MIRIPFTIRGGSASALGLAATQAAGFLVEFAVARRLGASGLGILAIGIGLSSTFGATIVTGFSSAASAYVARSHERGAAEAVGGHLRLALRLALLAAAVVGVGLIAIAEPLAAALGDEGGATAWVIRIFAAALPFQALGGVGVAVALALGRPGAEVRYRWLDAGVRALAIPALLLGNADVIAIAAIHLLAAVLSAPLGLRAAFGAAGGAVGSVRGELSQVLSLAGWQTLTTGAWLAARRLDVIVVSAILGAHAAGAYRLASVVTSLAGVVMLALQPVFFPVAARRFESSGEVGLADHYRRVTRFAMIVSAPVAAALVFGSDRIVTFFGAPFVFGNTAVIILAVGQAILAAGGHSTTVVQVAGAGGRAALNTVVATILQMGALLIMTPVLGVSGAALAAVFGVVTTHVLQIRTMQVRFGLTVFDERWLRAIVLVVMLLCSALLGLIASRQAPVLAIGIFVASTSAFAGLALRTVVPAGERAVIAGLFAQRAANRSISNGGALR